MNKSEATSTSTTREFKPSLQLLTLQPTARSVARSVQSTAVTTTATNKASSSATVVNEERYWLESFGLSSSADKKRSASSQNKAFAHVRAAVLRGSGVVQDVKVFRGTPTEAGGPKSTETALAVASGPRVQLYQPSGTLERRLNRRGPLGDTTRTTNEVVPPCRQLTVPGMATCVAWRADGRLLAVGTHQGQVRIVDAASSSRVVLQTFTTTSGQANSSSLSIRAVEWFRNGQHLLAAGDDGVLRVFCLGGTGDSGALSSAPWLTLTGHGDTIRSAALWQLPKQPRPGSSPGTDSQSSFPDSVVATASLDHTVRLWNVSTVADSTNDDRCWAVLVHGAPVQCVLWIKRNETTMDEQSSSQQSPPCWLLSAGGTSIKVWNPVTGQCTCTVDAPHRKTITCLVASTRQHLLEGKHPISLTRIVTAALDGWIRIYDWDGATGRIVSCLHGVRVLAPSTTTPSLSSSTQVAAITALAMDTSSAQHRVVVGTADGTVLVRQKGFSKSPHARQRPPKAGTFAYFTRGQNFRVPLASSSSSVADVAAGGTTVVEDPNRGKKRKLRPFDVALKQFRYGDALDEALETRMPRVVMAVLEELGQRRGLTIALSNRDEESLEPLLSFVVRYISRPRFAVLLIGVAHVLLDIYSDVAGQSELIDELFAKLQQHVMAERRTQTKLLRVVGQLDALLTAAEMDTTQQDGRM